MADRDLMQTLYDSIGVSPHEIRQEDVAYIEVHGNRILGCHLVPGFEVEADETGNGIDARIVAKAGARIEKPVQVCFGLVPETGLQRIVLDIRIEDDARVGLMAHCAFPNAREIRHEMDAVITLGRNAEYAYFERHIHGADGGVTIVPRSKVAVGEGARYRTDFELLRGRVGVVDLDLEVEAAARSVCDITARLYASGDDRIEIDERVTLAGEEARGALKSHLALRDTAEAEIRNTLRATAAYARGHVDCKEIVQGAARARAIPVVDVQHPKAHVTHEASIGSVDAKQLETLMSRGLDEDAASDLIIQGLLAR